MPCGQQQQQQQGAAQQQGTQQGTQHGAAAAPAAPPAGPARKKRRVEAQQPQQRSGKWWVAAPEQAAAAAAAAEQPAAEPPAAAAAAEQPALAADQAGDDSAPAPAPAAAAAFAANPWLAGLPAGFLESLPRAQVLPTRAQRARADFPCMAPLQAIPLHDLQPPGGAAAGRSLLVRLGGGWRGRRAVRPVSAHPPPRLPCLVLCGGRVVTRPRFHSAVRSLPVVARSTAAPCSCAAL